MWTVGHSRGVAQVAGESAVVAGLPAADVLLLRRAALVHDIGRVAVPVGVWAKPGPLTRGEFEQVRLHAYHSERVLDVAPGLRPLTLVALSRVQDADARVASSLLHAGQQVGGDRAARADRHDRGLPGAPVRPRRRPGAGHRLTDDVTMGSAGGSPFRRRAAGLPPALESRYSNSSAAPTTRTPGSPGHAGVRRAGAVEHRPGGGAPARPAGYHRYAGNLLIVTALDGAAWLYATGRTQLAEDMPPLLVRVSRRA